PDELSGLDAWKSSSAVALGLVLGLSTGEARALAIVAGTAVLVALVLVGRRSTQEPEAERQAFIFAIAAAFLFSPIVWTHYFALLVVPIALTRRTLSPLWFVPLAMWATTGQSEGQARRVVLSLVVWSGVLAGGRMHPHPVPRP